MAITQRDHDRALAFPLDHVRARYEQSHGLPPAVALLHERELKRYLLLCAEHADVRLPVSPVIDDLWHEFLLHTRDYADFCRARRSSNSAIRLLRSGALQSSRSISFNCIPLIAG